MGNAPEGLTSAEMDVMRKHATEVDKLIKQLLLTNKNLKKSHRKVDPKKLRETIKNRDVLSLVRQLLLTENWNKSQLWLEIELSRALNRKGDQKKLRETIKNRDAGRRWNMYDSPRKEGGIFKKRPMMTGKEVAQLMEKMK